ncbi:unnamed protein product [Porites lobata]|uniref:Apolipoprotein L3 n=1 Tax=Porites lobata TaxID=104759 RepID=A0ABN8MVR1_9CNID|nr:unnamed protein product [Porites lobata]
MAQNENLNENLERCSNELTESIQSWAEKRPETIEALRSLAQELLEHDKNVHIAKVSGSSFSSAGFVLVATGFGLAPVTFGTSTILSAVGGAMCAAGGATAAGSGLVGSKIFKTKLAKAQEIIEADRQAQESVEKLLNKLYLEISALSVGGAIDILSYNKNIIFFVKNLVDIGNFAQAAGGTAATTVASEGTVALLSSIGVASNVARIGLFTISAVALPFDIHTLVTSAMKIKSNGEEEPEAVRKLKELAAELEREMDKILEALRQFHGADKNLFDLLEDSGDSDEVSDDMKETLPG